MVFRWLRNERSRKRFSHTRLGIWVQVCGGFQVTWLVRCQFLFCHPPLPDMPCPPTREVLVECVKWKNYTLATFCVVVRQFVVMKIKVRLCGSAWHGSQQCVRIKFCSSVSRPKALKNVSAFCHTQLRSEIVLEKCEVFVQKSLSLKIYFEKKIRRQRFVVYIKIVSSCSKLNTIVTQK